MVDETWGQKHFCPNCRARFYDMGRNPVECPGCGRRIGLPGDGSIRRSPVTSGFEVASISPDGVQRNGGIVATKVPGAIAGGVDVLAGVAIDDDSRELDDGDREEADGTGNEGIAETEPYEIDEKEDELDGSEEGDDEEEEAGETSPDDDEVGDDSDGEDDSDGLAEDEDQDDDDLDDDLEDEDMDGLEALDNRDSDDSDMSDTL